MSNSLDSVQDRHSVGPDLGSNCFQRLSADDKLLLGRKGLRKDKFCLVFISINYLHIKLGTREIRDNIDSSRHMTSKQCWIDVMTSHGC